MSSRLDYEVIIREETAQAKRLPGLLSQIIPFRTVLDVGCGPGIYTEAFRSDGFNCFGIDIDDRVMGMPNLFLHDILKSLPDIVSLFSSPMVDLVVSLEVAEHLEPSQSELFVERLCDMTNVILFSAAFPGQGGIGHINCRPKSDWVRFFAKHGFYYDVDATNSFVNRLVSGYHLGWLRINGMVLRRC